ncbi:SusC/RagA family TonB-linked outer membrane protein [Flammeovirga sp. OC4]|uniref:SusC/RagA family TonB-linked outer membrane protein n=1 Tax=Flammeovirga sp. OC4 TaxID=1382345 RepID=UPI0005C78529|nr:SusC/RagA family TonB-linked outer membrane protein [Flammeovirga sp. OC4]
MEITNKQKIYRLLMAVGLTFMAHFALAQQQLTVKGVVTDAETGDPLIGVTIMIEETTSGVVTDYDGHYAFGGLPRLTKLVFSYVGYAEQIVEVGNKTILDIQLRPATENLEMVTVFGENQRDPRSITGSVSKINTKVFSTGTPAGSFDQLLQGQVAGLAVQASGEPGEASQIRIRGNNSLGIRSTDEALTTFNSANEPLYILNGTPISSAVFATINPDDIVEIKVLKDGLATVEYGVRGANGVIEIKTKRGIVGGTTYNVRYQHTIRPVGDLGGISLMKSHEKLALERELSITNGLGYIYSPKPGDLQPVLDYKAQKYAELEGTNTDWYKELSQVGQVKDLQVSISGGVHDTRFFVSANYYDEDGSYKNSWAKRFATRFSLDHNINNRLSIGFDASVARSQRSKSQTSPARLIYTLQPYETPGDTTFVSRSTNDGGVNFENPFDELYNTYRENTTWRVNVNPKIAYKFFKGLTARLEYGVAYSEAENTSVKLPNTEGVTVQQISGGVTKGESKMLTNRLNFNTEFIQSINNHFVSIVAGTEYVNNNNWGFGYNSVGISPKVDPSIGANPHATINNSKYTDALLGFYGRFSYSFKSKYDFTGSVRYDGSSVLPVGEQFVAAYGAGIAWDMRSERFMSSSKKIDQLKWRLSYGLNYNSGGIRQTLGLPFYDFTNSNTYRGNRIINLVEFYNPDLKFEKTKQWTAALDFGMLDNRLYGTVEVYIKNTDDLLSNISIPASNGYTSLLQNIGSLENRGIEISLSGVPVRTNHFRWTSRLNLAYNINKITDLYGQDEIRVGSEGYFKVGEPINSAFVRHWAGVNPVNGQSIYYTRSGELVNAGNAPQMIGFGTYDHPYTGGFTNTFNYKNLELSMLLTFAFNGVNYNNLKSTMIQNVKLGEVPFAGFYDQVWLEEGDVKIYPKPNSFGGNTANSLFLEDASYVRVKNVTVRYNLQQYLHLKHVENFMITAQANNLYTFTNYQGIDPEVTGIGQPLLQSYTLGVDVTF